MKSRVFVLSVIAASILILLAPAAARAASSVTDVRSSYTVTTGLTTPADGAVVSRGVTVTATVSFTGSNPGVQRAYFYLDGAYLLIDFQAPYTFSLPSDHFLDGTHTLSVQMLLRDGFTTSSASVRLTFTNGVLTPPVNSNTFTPARGTSPAPGQRFVVAASGDGADGETNAAKV
jgi:hypothetical protein